MELKEFLETFDLPAELADKPIDEAKTVFHEKFVSRAIAPTDPDIEKAVMGKRINRLEALAAKEFGLSKEEIEGKKFEDILSLGAKKKNDALEELKANSGSTDVTAWQEKVDKAANEAKTWKQAAKEKEDLLKQKESEWQGEVKSVKLDYAVSSLKSRIPLSDDATELAKKGYNALVNEKYLFDFDEAGELVALDRKTKQPIINDSKTGHYSAEDVLKLEAKQNNILKMPGQTGTAGRQTPGVTTTTKTGITQNGVQRVLPKGMDRYKV